MNTKQAILELVKRSDEPLTPLEAATRLDLGYETVKKCMARLARAGQLTVDRGRYSITGDTDHGDNTTDAGDTTKHGDSSGPRVRTAERGEWEESPTFWIA